MSGNELVTTVSPIIDTGGAQFFPVTATQNGCSVQNELNFLSVT
jgi:hypothetical protein